MMFIPLLCSLLTVFHDVCVKHINGGCLVSLICSNLMYVAPRCQLHDKEVMCGDKDLIIGELKEKVVALNGRTRQLEAQVNDLHHQNMQVNIFNCALLVCH